MSEIDILQSIRLRVGSRYDVRLWRNNTGAFRDADGRFVEFGLCKGSADLIGYQTVTVTPDMVGQQVAVFLAIEVKTPKGRTTEAQETFLRRVAEDGGLAGVARDEKEALEILHA